MGDIKVISSTSRCSLEFIVGPNITVAPSALIFPVVVRLSMEGKGGRISIPIARLDACTHNSAAVQIVKEIVPVGVAQRLLLIVREVPDLDASKYQGVVKEDLNTSESIAFGEMAIGAGATVDYSVRAVQSSNPSVWVGKVDQLSGTFNNRNIAMDVLVLGKVTNMLLIHLIVGDVVSVMDAIDRINH